MKSKEPSPPSIKGLFVCLVLDHLQVLQRTGICFIFVLNMKTEYVSHKMPQIKKLFKQTHFHKTLCVLM